MTLRRSIFTRVDRYLLWRLAPRMGVALLLERILRLIDLVAIEGASLQLAAFLAPGLFFVIGLWSIVVIEEYAPPPVGRRTKTR